MKKVWHKKFEPSTHLLIKIKIPNKIELVKKETYQQTTDLNKIMLKSLYQNIEQTLKYYISVNIFI